MSESLKVFLQLLMVIGVGVALLMDVICHWRRRQ